MNDLQPTQTLEDLTAEVEPWLQQCGSCDAGLMMGCTCPQGDYRNILLKVWTAYLASQSVVEPPRDEATVKAEALEEAAEVIILPGASSRAAAWLQGRAARLRAGGTS